MKSYRHWLDKEDCDLVEMRGDGMTVGEIAAVLGRTIPSVKVRLQQMRIRSGRRSSRERWLALLMRPHTIRGVAAEMGLTYWAVKAAKRRLRRSGYLIPPALYPDRSRPAS